MFKRLLLSLVAGACLQTGAFAADPDFYVQDANTRLVDHVYLLDAQIDFVFSRQTLDALDSGIPLTVRLDIEVRRTGPWWWFDGDVAALEQRFQLHFYPLSNQYLVRNLNSGALYAYPTLTSALDALGDVRGLPLLDDKLVEADEAYQVGLRARLDIESLPSPLRPLAYISPGWRLGSDWYVCSLTP